MGRIVDGEKRDDLDFDQSIIPASLSEYVGQTDIKENLKNYHILNDYIETKNTGE